MLINPHWSIYFKLGTVYESSHLTQAPDHSHKEAITSPQFRDMETETQQIQ